MQSEPTATGLNLGLSVLNPDDSSNDDAAPIQRNPPQTIAQLSPEPLPVPGVALEFHFPQQPPLQQPQSPYTAHPTRPRGARPMSAISRSNHVGSASSFKQSVPDARYSMNVPQSEPTVNPSPAPTPIKFDRRESVDKLIVMVTADAENHAIVDITGAKDAASIRERMFSKLRIPDDDRQNYQIYRTELGEAALGDPITDDQLMIYCGAWADAKGTLKFLVQRNPTPPPQPQSATPTQATTTGIDLTALESCLQGLSHLFIGIDRLKKEARYKEKRGGYSLVRIYRLDSGTPKSKLVAGKRIHLGGRHLETQSLLFRLARELKVWAALRHPHILPLLGYYLDTEYKKAVLISEYQIYGDLKDYIEQEKPTLGIRLQLIRDSTDGLAYLHGRSPPIRHGDLKPGNVFINARRQAMLADFGLSKSLGSGPTGLTTSKGLKGTLRYYSPELLKEEISYDLQSDIWAWGCLALEVLTNRIPYAEKINEMGIILAIVSGKPPSEIEDSAIPVADFKHLLGKCWSPEPSKRPPAAYCLRILNSTLSVSKMDHRIESTEVQHASRPNEDDEEEHYYDSDSSEEDARFWNIPNPSAPLATATPRVMKASGPEKEGNSTLGPPNRTSGSNPTLTISPLVDDQGSPMPTSSGGINRRASICRPKSVRPREEDILERLQDFFPDHDLDEPFIDQVQTANDESPVGATLPPPAPSPPTIRWVKGELIGRGTYGRVFLALNATTGEMMAVKQVEMPQTISDQEDVRQLNIIRALETEQQNLEKLDHPNIVQYLGFEKTKEFFSVFLEYVPGSSIGSYLRRHGKIEENIVKSFTGQIIDGLAYLHANKLIHRDIKADNVLVDQSGYCKISDFAMSKQSEDIYHNAGMTAMQGSLFWMAPEMLHNDRKGYSAKVDIWSLGCVFIEMFAGRRPWEQDDFVSVMVKVGRNKMAPPVPSDVHLSPEAEDFRLKCFTQDPDERPTAEGLKSHLWLDLPPGWVFPGLH